MSDKVNLLKAKKVELGKLSLPRPEIDILAYQVSQYLLLWVECKSYLDSRGVTIAPFMDKNDKGADRYEVFTRPDYRRIATGEFVKQLVASKTWMQLKPAGSNGSWASLGALTRSIGLRSSGSASS